MSRIYSVIIGTGSYIPENIIRNQDFEKNEFFDEKGEKIDSPTETIIDKFTQITEIERKKACRGRTPHLRYGLPCI
jgi:3-oxoacyl-[acyl-carrier-protein] synthase-3